MAWLGTAIFCKMPRILLRKQSEGLGAGQGLLVPRVQLQQRLVFHVMMCHSPSLPPPLSSPGRICTPMSPVRRHIVVSHHYLCQEACPLEFIITWGFCNRPLGRWPGQSGTCIKELRALQPSIQFPPLDSPDHCGKSKSYLHLSFLSSGFLKVSFAECSTTLS